MAQILTTILIILTLVMTFGVCIIKPQMHSRVIVYDSSYEIVEEKNNKEEIENVVEVIAQKTIEEPKANVQKTEIKEIKNNKIEEKKTVVKNEEPKAAKTVEVKKETKPISKAVVQKEAPTPTIQTKKTETPKTETIQTLTEQQETIAWNKWHSDIQNQLMQDVKLPILPNGVVFHFSFTVDKYGKITNIQTYSTNPKYTPYAIEYIAPVIRSYQGKAIVEFPKGSKREITNFKGGWKLSNEAKFSRPEDYNDSEVIRK